MGYIIEYKQEICRKPLKKQTNSRLWAMTGGFFCLFLLICHLYWPEGLSAVRELLLPEGNAVSTLVSDLQNGSGFAEAVESFCQQVFGDG